MQVGVPRYSLARFDQFLLDMRTGELRHAGGTINRLPEQSFQILIMLLQRPGEVVSREEMRKRLWPNDTVVEFEHSISAAMNRLRQALGDSGSDPTFIETLARRGYRWMRLVEWMDGSPAVVKPFPDSAASPSPGSLIGRKISHYRVLEFLGGGGMGVVYEAEDVKLARRVALKFLPEELSGDPSALERFEREARAASALNHPNICTIYEIDEHNGQPFIVMELLEGNTLRDTIFATASHGPLQLTRLLGLAIQIAAGLEAAHQRGIVHRDIKPSNIFITCQGEAKILDFGVAKLLEFDEPAELEARNSPSGGTLSTESSKLRNPHLTRTGAALGTEGYMSPEQVRGEDLDARTDLFSFGLVLYEMATGQRAFSGDTVPVVHGAILNQAPVPVRQISSGLPARLGQIIDKALEKNRLVRYQSSAQMRSDLMSILDSRQAATVKPRILIAIAGAALLAVTLGVLWLQSRHAPPAEIRQQQLTRNANDNPIASVTVSPDGKYFAYSDLGGLHVKLLKTGEIHDFPQPPELGKSRASWLVSWLPDSVHFLAAAFGLGVPPSTWEASVISGSLRILRKDAVTWSVSPDGSQFAFTDKNDQKMWLMDIGGDRPRKVADAGAKNWFSYVEWSPDGSHLLYIKRVPTAGHVQNSMELRDLKSGSTTTLLSNDLLGSLSWLRDGRILYVERDPDTNGDTCRNWIARADGTSAGFSTKPRQLAQGSRFCISSASATADGKQLYFLKQTSEFSVYVADLDPGATRISPPRHLTLTEDREFPTAWTADSDEIVLVSNRGGKWGFYRQSLNGDTAKPILTGIASLGLGTVFPSVSPDGAWLVYAPYPIDYEAGTPMDVLKVPISGGSPQLIMKAAVYDIPRCTRAPATICAVATKNKDQLIFTGFDVGRGAVYELARLKIDDPDKYYTWDISPDGTRIATLKRGTSEIHVFSLRTHADQKIIVKGWDGLAALDWASDGKGLFTSSLSTGSVLLHTDLHGNASVLWEPKGNGMTWAISSPDSRHVAMPGFAQSSNVWSMESF